MLTSQASAGRSQCPPLDGSYLGKVALKRRVYNRQGCSLLLTQETDRDDFEALIRENVILAPMTTLHIGGPARFFADVRSSVQMEAGIRWASQRGVPAFVLGGGSNIVVSDHGFPGLVLRNLISGLEM